jgi:hypothetical protein
MRLERGDRTTMGDRECNGSASERVRASSASISRSRGPGDVELAEERGDRGVVARGQLEALDRVVEVLLPVLGGHD